MQNYYCGHSHEEAIQSTKRRQHRRLDLVREVEKCSHDGVSTSCAEIGMNWVKSARMKGTAFLARARECTSSCDWWKTRAQAPN